MNHCPFALDFTQEELILEMYNDEQANRMKLPRGEWPQWLDGGFAYLKHWIETHKD